MDLAFVIQPFDNGGPYDKRYAEVICPALEELGLKPYRVDRDPSARVLIDTIKDGISQAKIVICEITEDNPNVWFELGFAIALEKECFMLCSSERSKLPFDVQHELVIYYKRDSPSDFKNIDGQLKERIMARLENSPPKVWDGEPISDTLGSLGAALPGTSVPVTDIKPVVLPDDTPF